MDFEVVRNASKNYTFRKMVDAGDEGYLSARLVAHGFITSISVRFSAGESGTLQLRPVVIWPGELSADLIEYADNGDKYITGDDETIKSNVRFEIENNSELRVYYKNTGVGTSFVNVDIEVVYFEVSEPVNVIGPVHKRRWF